MTTDQPPPDESREDPFPEALLIRRSRDAVNLTQAEAARRAGTKLAERRWRQLEEGKERAPDKTLAHMAAVVGVSPEDLIAVDRLEAAETLRRILALRIAEEPPPAAAPIDFPEGVKGDPFFEWIWRFDGVPEAERQMAIHGVRLFRNPPGSSAGYSQSDRRRA